MSMKQVWKKLTANKKQFGIIISLLCVGLLMWGRLLLKQLPKSAVAKPTATQSANGDPTAGVIDGFKLDDRKTVEVALIDVSRRSLFSLDDTAYEKIPEKVDVKPDQQNLPQQKTENEIRTEIRTGLAKQVSALKLKTVILGGNPQVLINDRIYPMGGQPLPGFVISKPTSHSVTLTKKTEHGVFEFVIKMYRD